MRGASLATRAKGRNRADAWTVLIGSIVLVPGVQDSSATVHVVRTASCGAWEWAAMMAVAATHTFYAWDGPAVCLEGFGVGVWAGVEVAD